LSGYGASIAPSTPIRKFSNFYPGNEYLDILSLDVYGSDFNQDYYDSLKALSQGKPLVLGEVGNPPVPEILDTQPDWTLWVIWAGMVRNLSKNQHLELVNDPRILSMEDPAYWEAMAVFREACGLDGLPLKSKYPADFTGEWLFNEEISTLGNAGSGRVPYKMKVNQDDELLFVKKYNIVEWGDDRVSDEEIDLEGREMKSTFFNSPRISTVSWDNESGTMTISTSMTFTRGGNATEIKSSEAWSLQKEGSVLSVYQKSTGFRGNENIVTLIYEKQ